MKVLKDTKLIHYLAAGINIFFYMHLLIFVFLLIFDHVNPFDDPTKFTIRGRVGIFERNLTALPDDSVGEFLNENFLIRKSGFIRFDYTSVGEVLTLNNFSYFMLDSFCKFLWLVMTFQIRQVFRSTIRLKIFDSDNLKRVRFISGVLFLIPFVQYFTHKMFAFVVRQEIVSDENFIPEGVFIVPIRDFNEPLIAIALLVLAIGEIFRYGVQLQTQNDLTI